MKKAIIAVVLLLGAARAGAQGVDVPEAVPVDSSCLVLWQNSPLFPGPGYVWINPDSVRVDMCQGLQYLDEFGRGPFLVRFLYYIIPDSLALEGDTLVHDWRDIDSSFSALRNGLDSIEQRIGRFTMVHGGGSGHVDTSEPNNKIWYLSFTNYVNIDTADFYLSQLPDVDVVPGIGPEVSFEGYPRFYQGVNHDKARQRLKIWPQPCTSELHIGGLLAREITLFDALGRQFRTPVKYDGESIVVDVSKVPNGSYYFSAQDQFFTILIQR